MAGQSKDTGPPILFMKTGVIGAEPKGFYDSLATAYDATIISPQALHTARSTRGRPKGAQRERVNRQAQNMAHEALSVGANVIYDGRLNHYERRETIRQTVARPAGAHVILLCVQAPVWLMEKRLIEKAQAAHPDDAESREIELRNFHGAMHRMIHAIEWPRESEPYLNLDGQQPVEMLIRQTQEYVTAQLAIAPAERRK